MSQATPPTPSSQPPQQIPAFFDVKTITAYPYPRMLVAVLATWCFAGIILMFFGNAWTDTIGLVLTVAETIFILTRDRTGFYTSAGFWKVAEWTSAQRTMLAVLEVPFYFIALALYIVRITARQYQMLDQTAPLTPPAKRKPPRR